MRGLSLPRLGAFAATTALAAAALTAPVFAQTATPLPYIPPPPNTVSATPTPGYTSIGATTPLGTTVPTTPSNIQVVINTPVQDVTYDVHDPLAVAGFAKDTTPDSSIVAIDLYLNTWPGTNSADFLGRIEPGTPGQNGAGFPVPAGYTADDAFSFYLNPQVDPITQNNTSAYTHRLPFPAGGNSLNIVVYGSDGTDGYFGVPFTLT